MKEHGQKAACGGLLRRWAWAAFRCAGLALAVGSRAHLRRRCVLPRVGRPGPGACSSDSPETPSQPSARKHLQEQWHMMHREDITVAPLVLYVKAALQMGLLGIFDAALLRASRRV